MATKRVVARPVGEDGEWVVEIMRQREFTRRQVAVALARTRARRPIGEQTVQTAARAEAARGPGGRRPDAARVATYLTELDDDLWGRAAKERRPGEERTLLVYEPVHYNLEDAAAALATLYRKRPPKPGHRTAHRGLITFTNEPSAADEGPAAGEVDFWRELLIREFGFPPPRS